MIEIISNRTRITHSPRINPGAMEIAHELMEPHLTGVVKSRIQKKQ